MISVIVPSRGRPREFWRLWESLDITATDPTGFGYKIMLGRDNDDGSHYGLFPVGVLPIRPMPCVRPSIAAWTNLLAFRSPADYYLICGDDYVMRTHGWDKTLPARCIHDIGAAYPDDCYNHKPTAILVPHAFVEVLGYLAWPKLKRWYIDAWIEDVCRRAGMLTYVPEVKFEHMHLFAGKAERDATYDLACIDGVPSDDVLSDKREYENGYRIREREARKLVAWVQARRGAVA